MCRFSLSVSLCAPVAPAELDGKKVEQNQREYLHRLSAQKKMFVLLRWRGTRVCVCVWLWLCVAVAVCDHCGALAPRAHAMAACSRSVALRVQRDRRPTKAAKARAEGMRAVAGCSLNEPRGLIPRLCVCVCVREQRKLPPRRMR